jgi:PKD repeat protein
MRIRKSRSRRKVTKNLFNSESAVSTVLAAVLLLSIIFTIFAVVRIAYVPEWKNDAEAAHMHDVLEDMSALRSAIDNANFYSAYSKSPPTTSISIRMGGGQVPFIDSSRNDASLLVNKDPCSANLTLRNLSGGVLYSGSFNCGGVTYYSNNIEFVDQTLRYENGALILAQGDRSVMRQNPPFSLVCTNITENSINLSASINIINMSKTVDSVSSNTVESLRLTPGLVQQKSVSTIDTFQYEISTKFPEAWIYFFNQTAENANLNYGTDYIITKTLIDPNLGLYAVTFDLIHTTDKFVNNMTINDCNIDASRCVLASEKNTSASFLRKPPDPGFEFSPTTGTAPLDIQIVDTSIGANSYSYNFGDGSSLMNTSQPKHTYESSGTYNITQTVTNSHGSANLTKTIRVKQLPFAYFYPTPNYGYAPLEVTFEDHSTDTILWYWDFGDGTNSSLQNPTHTYTNAGVFTVVLTASNEDGNSTYTDTITVNQHPPVASFTANPTTGKKPLTVQFTDTSTYSPTSWSWRFGDKGTSIEQNPEHTFKDKGTYTVILTVYNSGGSSNTQMTITVTG